MAFSLAYQRLAMQGAVSARVGVPRVSCLSGWRRRGRQCACGSSLELDLGALAPAGPSVRVWEFPGTA